jgi:hypothetical protein
MSQGITYDVDVRLCIDTTGSMSPYITQVKERAIMLPDDLLAQMKTKDKGVHQLRVGVDAFGDYSYDGDKSMRSSAFFELPAQTKQYQAWVNGLTLVGGGDEPESGQEALATAMRAEWTRGGDKRRHVVVVLTDASTHNLGRAKGQPNYPDWMPADLGELTDWWEGQTAKMDRSAKRLLLFAPDGNGWSEIGASWENTVHVHARAGEGLKDQDYEGVLAAIAESV